MEKLYGKKPLRFRRIFLKKIGNQRNSCLWVENKWGTFCVTHNQTHTCWEALHFLKVTLNLWSSCLLLHSAMVIHVRPSDSYTWLLCAFKVWWSTRKHRAMLFYVFHPRLGYLTKDWVMGAQQGLSSKRKWKDERKPDSWQVCMRVFWEWDHLSLRNNSIQLYLLLFYPGLYKKRSIWLSLFKLLSGLFFQYLHTSHKR